MNCLILTQMELIEPAKALIRDERARRLHSEWELSVGQTLRVGVLEGKLGQAKVISIAHDIIELSVVLDLTPPKRDPTELIVAVPRPQTVKKVIQSVTTMGVSKLHFVRSENSEKSYLASHSLREEEIQKEIIKGLEQACDTIAPEVIIYPKFKPFIEEYLSKTILELNPLMIVAHTRDADTSMASQVLSHKMQPIIISVGPELGWSEYEFRRILELGFKPVSLGERVLRVETAATALIAQAAMLRATAISGHGSI